MDSGIYVLRFPNKYFYIGKSENIPKRWQQHWKDFENGTHSRKMQAAYNQYGYPTREVLVSCHADHCDIYESLAIEYNMCEKCLNGNQPRKVPREDWDTLLNSGEYAKISTVEHMKMLKSQETQIEAQDEEKDLLEERLHTLKTNGVLLPEEIEENIKNINQDFNYIAEKLTETLTELKRLDNLNWFDRLFNYKVKPYKYTART